MANKILHISKYYFPFLGGVENICKYLVEQMSQYETSVVCFNEGRADAVDDRNSKVQVLLHARCSDVLL